MWLVVFFVLIIAAVVAILAIQNSKKGKAWKEEQARQEREAKLKAQNDAWLKQYKAGEAERQRDREEFDAWLEGTDKEDPEE